LISEADGLRFILCESSYRSARFWGEVVVGCFRPPNA